eukprot:gene1158-6712_t
MAAEEETDMAVLVGAMAVEVAAAKVAVTVAAGRVAGKVAAAA